MCAKGVASLKEVIWFCCVCVCVLWERGCLTALSPSHGMCVASCGGYGGREASGRDKGSGQAFGKDFASLLACPVTLRAASLFRRPG